MWKRINESSPILARFLLFICAPIGIAAAAGYGYLKQSVPLEDGVVAVQGVGGSVRIERGADTVPRITAASDADAYFALGYVHARDRLWQMEYQKLIGQGRLSELRGAATLALDQYIRTLGLSRAAGQALAQLTPRSRELLDAYVRGVNAWIGESHPLPPEYYVNGRRPETWSATDSLLQLKLLQIDLDDSSVELLRQNALVRQLGSVRAAQLLSADNGRTLAVTAAAPPADGALLRQIDTAAARLHREFGIGAADAGSAAWAVNGSRTRSGMPALVNDLHAASLIPSRWYLSEVRGPTVHVAGATIPGLPLFFSGRNESIAWGGTALRAVAPQLIREKIDPLDSNRYWNGDAWHTMASRSERIAVKSAFPAYLRGPIKPVALTVRHTARGPVISDLADAGGATYTLALAGLDPQDRSFDALLALNGAQDWAQARTAMRDYGAPALQLVYADRQGNIGGKLVGKLASGTVAPGVSLPAAPAGAGPVSYIAYQDLPETYNPDGGMVLQAGADRTARIAGLLQANGKATPEALLSIQHDDLSLGAADALPGLLQLPAGDTRQQQALDYLRRWDRHAAPDSVAASIYNVWIDHLFADLVRGNATDRLAARQLLTAYSPEARARFVAGALRQSAADWCAVPGQPAQCRPRLARTLQSALDQLQITMGATMADWRWSAVQHAAYRSGAVEDGSPLASLFARRAAAPGDNYSVGGAAPAVYSADDGYQRVAGSNYLQVIDFGDAGRSRFTVSTGQSGNFFSPAYDNFMQAASTALPSLGFGNQRTGASVLTLTASAGKAD
jgi:penicillin amidase